MSRILVADDNSNIQKMVALALKDEGIDVVAVGNGEAAMRKIPDLRPDLVLADIFMPVRNGYEVCEFVKSDSRYMSTPVVLLVGAFDPLDEQETQRVRADGVLKKPFVPPDPLINMVKALLAKSNGQKAMPVQTPIQPKAAIPPQATPAPASQPSPNNVIAATELMPHQGAISPPSPEKPPTFVAVTSPPTPHIEPAIANAADSDEVVTAVRDPNLGEPFWATPAESEEQEDKSENETKPADMLDMHSFGKEGASLEEEEDGPSFRPDASLLDGVDFGADSGAPTASENQAATPQQTNRPQPAVPDEYEISADVVPVEKEAAPPSSAPPETPSEIFRFDPTLTFPSTTQSDPVDNGATESEPPASVESVELAVNEYAATISLPPLPDSPAKAPVTSERPHETYEQVAPIELELPALPNRDAVITAATEAARLAFSELNTLPGSERHSSETEPKNSPAVSAPPATPASPSPEMIDAVVNRLLERMQPQIMEVVNREVLRPAIEAIVRREMKKP